MKVALEYLRRVVKEEHYQMFDLYVIKQWPPAKVAQTLGVSIGQVYLAKYRLGALLKKEVRRLEASEGQIG
jgi:RNA polymerase sigma-70 factor (ECF subfamily)